MDEKRFYCIPYEKIHHNSKMQKIIKRVNELYNSYDEHGRPVNTDELEEYSTLQQSALKVLRRIKGRKGHHCHMQSSHSVRNRGPESIDSPLEHELARTRRRKASHSRASSPGRGAH